MRKVILFGFILTGLCFSSCTKDETQMEDSKLLSKETVTIGKKGVLQFGSVEELASNIQSWFNDSQNKSLTNNPRGLFTTRDGDCKIVVIFPQGEGGCI